MSDKDVTRNVRGSGEDGIPTSTQKHYHSISEKGNLTYGKNAGSHDAKRQELLAKFKERELRALHPSPEQAPRPETGQDADGEATPAPEPDQGEAR